MRSAEEFIAYAKANPGKLNYASQGTGTTSHLTAELFQTRTGAKLVHVPYKGTAPAVERSRSPAMFDLMFSELASMLELHRAGKVRLLAIATAKTISSAAGNSDSSWNSGVANSRVVNLERHFGAAEDAASARQQAERCNSRHTAR